MSQPTNQNQNDYFYNIHNIPHSQPINNNINQMLEDSHFNKINSKNDENNDFIYELVFNTISTIYNSDKTNDIKIKIIRIITKIIENILETKMKTVKNSGELELVIQIYL